MQHRKLPLSASFRIPRLLCFVLLRQRKQGANLSIGGIVLDTGKAKWPFVLGYAYWLVAVAIAPGRASNFTVALLSIDNDVPSNLYTSM